MTARSSPAGFPAGAARTIAQTADNAVTGGNARGANAVDWQQFRVAAAQVASGQNSTVGGGASNTASATNSTVAGGQANNAAGTNSCVGGGNANTASGFLACVSGGNSNNANGQTSWIPGGHSATTRAVTGRGAWAANRIVSVGDAQCGEHHIMRQTTDATGTRLTADSAAASTMNTINLPNFSAYAGRITVVSRVQGGGSASWEFFVHAERGNGAATTALSPGSIVTAAPPAQSIGTGSACRLDIAADTVNGGIAVTVTGAAATTINHSARFANVEATTAS